MIKYVTVLFSFLSAAIISFWSDEEYIFNFGENKVMFVAHRGASFQYPENTILAFEKAFQEGADAIECDVWMTKDNQIVVIHDPNAFRTTGKNFDIKNVNYDDLMALDAGKWKSPYFDGQKVPLLEDVLNIVPANKKIIIEIKDNEKCLEQLHKVLLNSGKISQCEIIAFDFETLISARKEIKEVPMYWLIYKEEQKKDIVSKLKKSDLQGVNAKFNLIDDDFANDIKFNNLRLYTWTVNEITDARKLANFGVDAITTDRAEWLKSNLTGNVKAQPRAFSHNDYEQTKPLINALSNGFCAVEADVYLRDGKLLVSHDEPIIGKAKSIEELYFYPIKEHLISNGGNYFKNYYGQFYLMIDIKDNPDEVVDKLYELLNPYSDFLSNVENDKFTQGYVTIFISGKAPREKLMKYKKKILLIDGDLADIGKGISSDVMPVISSSFKELTQWDGNTPTDSSLLEKIRDLASKVKSENKKLRLYHSPDTEYAWQLLYETGVDFITTDNPDRLGGFLRDLERQ